LTKDSLTPQQREVWDQVDRLWRLAVAKDSHSIELLLHPEYVGWVIGDDLPHNRLQAVTAAVADTGTVTRYSLSPLAIQLYDGRLAVVHYRYQATFDNANAPKKQVSGRWTETYLKQDARWLLICVVGGPDPAIS
jgi:hypothetical protein